MVCEKNSEAVPPGALQELSKIGQLDPFGSPDRTGSLVAHRLTTLRRELLAKEIKLADVEWLITCTARSEIHKHKEALVEHCANQNEGQAGRPRNWSHVEDDAFFTEVEQLAEKGVWSCNEAALEVAVTTHGAKTASELASYRNRYQRLRKEKDLRARYHAKLASYLPDLPDIEEDQGW